MPNNLTKAELESEIKRLTIESTNLEAILKNSEDDNYQSRLHKLILQHIAATRKALNTALIHSKML